MSALPPPSALKAARIREQQALAAVYPGKVTIGSRTYACALDLGPVEPKLADDGINYRNGQDAIIRIAKSALAASPAARTTLTIDGTTYRVVHGGQQNEYEQAWRIVARRFT